jgi:hypothetical protein
MVTNTNAGASGQSTMSIASGLGSQYPQSQYTAPVVQMPNNGIAMYSQVPTQASQTQFMPQSQFPTSTNAFGQQVAPVYSVPVHSGVQYGPAPINQNPYQNHYQNPGFNTTVTSPVATAVVPAAAWTTTTANGGYIGNGPQQFAQPAISTQPATMTPLGPPVITSVPANQNGMTYGPNTVGPNTVPAFGPMPGSMGSSIMPGSVYPSATYPPTTNPSATYPSTNYPPNSVYPSSPGTAIPSLRDSESAVAPQLPPTTYKPILPPENSYPQLQQPTEIMPSNILPDSAEDGTRFQLRRVERDMMEPSTSQGASPNSSLPANPFNSQNDAQTLNKPFSEPNSGASGSNPGLMQSPSLEKPAGNEAAPGLEMRLESLKPIPAPPSFDASPTWRPVLLTPRDQTAGLPDRSPTSNLAASHQIVPSPLANVRPSRAPAPNKASSMTIEEELQSNLVYFNRPQQSRHP